jgi:Uma2 family endonuclease
MEAATLIELAASDRIAPLSRARYDAMVEAGVLGPDDQVELLYGVLVKKMSPQDPKHARAVQKLTRLLDRAIGDSLEVRTQLPFAVSDDSEPEPDLCVVAIDVPPDRHPTHALLVVEVAMSSRRHDRTVKGPLYAAAQVPAFWLVDVERQLVEVYTDPLDGRYSTTRVARPGERLPIPQLDGAEVDVTAIFS